MRAHPPDGIEAPATSWRERVERRAAADERRPEREEAEMPPERAAEIVVDDVVVARRLVVDQAFDEVEGAPAGQQQAEVVVGRAAASSPACRARTVRGPGAGRDAQARRGGRGRSRGPSVFGLQTRRPW